MGIRIAIMQPYLFPYLGYFQLVSAADIFVLFDDVQYINRGWVNRNRILVDGKAEMVTFPLKKADRAANINQRVFADNFEAETERILRKIVCAYAKAPFFRERFPTIALLIRCCLHNLSEYAENAIKGICEMLCISTPIMLASSLAIRPELRGQDRVIEIVRRLGGTAYINPIGGCVLYQAAEFSKHGIKLFFHRMDDVTYPQFGNAFQPALSIIDVLMFNSMDAIRRHLSRYSLLSGEIGMEIPDSSLAGPARMTIAEERP